MSNTPHTEAPFEAVPAVWHQGLTVGRYHLLARIAVGGMAEIWLARQAGLKGFEKFVVIKRILDGLGTDPEFVAMFLDEARIAAQLNHPHIVQIFDLGEEAGAFFIAMEYLPGENLAAIARTGARQSQPLPIPLAVRVIADAAEGLAYAHTKTGPDGKLLGIVHRDVSPQNILVTYDGVVKVVDFGIAKAATRESQTMVGQVKGKTAYMSPEQAKGQSLDARSDIFALGILLFELVTRSRLFQFSDPLEALRVVASDDPIPLAHERNPEVPATLGLIIARALARDPDQRYSTGRQFQYALEEWLRSQPEVPGAAELAAYMHERFGARIQERAKMLEAARNGEVSSTGIRRAVSSNTGDSMPGRAQVDEETTLEQSLRKRSRLSMTAAAVGGLLLLGGMGAFFALRSGGSVEPVPPPVATPPVAPAPPILTIETDPPGALIKVDGQEVGHSPLTLDTLSVGEHSVAASLEGRLPAERQVKLANPGERAMVLLALAVEPAPTPNPPPTSTETASPSASQSRPAKKAAMGKLTLDTTPWTRVFLRKQRLGDTPLIDVQLPAGKYQLKLVNEEKNISTVIEVEIRAGQTTAKKLRL
ncbi:serine/threonine-protein kinase [Hyalangium minutum]|uniref:Serine/threonine protein kinase n=1 Tax=Hyalangium minutum TaxID=394096 RepID=A0A085VXI7_9BACT|nr:serine/threonine-protein kinase [Hyalangium minutum]KFE60150.1 serine/threonine protein kinase [Hyalangium minutum]